MIMMLKCDENTIAKVNIYCDSKTEEVNDIASLCLYIVEVFENG